MIGWMVSSSVLLAVLLLLRRVLRGRISPRLGYALWGLALVRLLIPFSLGSSPVSVASLLQTSAPDEALSSAVVGYVGADLPDLAPPVPDPALPEEEQAAQYEENLAQWQAELDAARAETGTPVTVEHILMAVWGCGALLLALCFLWANLRLGRALRRTRQLLPQRAGRLPVYLTPAVDTPCLFGLVRPAVYLTPAAAQDPVTARHAVEHEYTHYRHADHLWAALRCVCLCLHWYNPLVWWAALASRNDGELACDEATVRRLGEEERAAYGRTLIALTCVKRPALLTTATTMTGSGKTLQARIAAIVKRPRTAAITFAVVLLIAAVAAGCTLTGSRPSQPEEDPPATASDPAASDPVTSDAATSDPGQDPEPTDPADPTQITLPAGLDAQGAAEQFVQTAYPDLFLGLPASDPRSFLRYELMDWSVREVSEDGSAVVGTFHYAFEPADWNSPEIWAGSTHMGSGEYAELAANKFQFLLCRGEDGTWTCVSVATGGVQLP